MCFLVLQGECEEDDEDGNVLTREAEDCTLDPPWLSPSLPPTPRMKFAGESEILGLSCEWTNGDTVGSSHKGLIDEDEDSKSAIDDLNDLLLTSQTSSQEPNNNSLAELKPLPPFTGYTGHLSINGIPGHHYHTIAAAPSPPRLESNNSNGNNNCSDSSETSQAVFYPDVSSSTVDCALENIKTEPVDYNSLLAPDIEDIAAIIGSAIADTTSQNNNQGESSKDGWSIDIDEWIDNAYQSTNGKTVISAESLQEFVSNSGFGVGATIFSYTPGPAIKREPYMPLLQSRLQNGPPKPEVYGEGSPSSSTGPYLAHSPPGVVSTSDLSRYGTVHTTSLAHTTTPAKPKSKSKSKAKSAVASSTVVYAEPGPLGKEKPVHRCTICNRGFLNKSNIKVHLRTHTGEKPFRCEVCGKAFRQKAHLIKHAQIHKRIGRD